jgi:hypothetical protein
MFRWTINDPLIEQVIDKGKIAGDAVLRAFSEFPWGAMLAKMDGRKEEEIHFPPSVGFTNLDDGHSIEIVLIEDERETLFYLFYDESDDEEFRWQLLDQTPEAAVEVLADFVAGRYDRVRARFESA